MRALQGPLLDTDGGNTHVPAVLGPRPLLGVIIQ